MTSFKIQNKFLVGLASWLSEIQLGGIESRERTRFVNILVERIQENEKFRLELLDKYTEKDEEGNKKKKMNEFEEEVWDLSPENTILYTKEFGELMDEDFVMDILDGNKQKIKVMKEVVLNTNYVFGPRDTDSPQEKIAKIRQMNDYDSWCQAFEKVEFAE